MSDEDDEFLPLRRDTGNIARDGAAADGAEADEIARLPRVLRYACLSEHGDPMERILAEIVEVAPSLAETATIWAEDPRNRGWRELAACLDLIAVERDAPTLRGVSDAVRLTSMDVGDARQHPGDALRVIAALKAGVREASGTLVPASTRLIATFEEAIIGWTSLVAGDRDKYVHSGGSAHRQALQLGHYMTSSVRKALKEAHAAKQAERRREEAEKAAKDPEPEPVEVPPNHVRVCPPLDVKSNAKLRDACKGHEHVIGLAMPLTPMPDLVAVRRRLLFEFPYAEHTIDALVAPMVGRVSVHFPPVVLVGPPGAGKSHLAGRLASLLGVGLWRCDGGRADGSIFGGTDRRWYSAEPSHPLLAISRSRTANPLVLIDEIEKAGTRSDYGRLWDALLSFLEPETSKQYPDPCLQVDLCLSHVSYIATANTLLPLPSPLLDRLRVVEVPEPGPDDLDRLVGPLMLDHARERGLDERWVEPLSPEERDLLASRWRGGSVRRLRGYVDVVLRARDRARTLS